MLGMPKETILIIEDEEDLLELLQYNLSKEGYSVTGVKSGEEALEQIKIFIPDLVIVDLMLPGINGFEVCKNIKSDHKKKHIIVVMLTARDEEQDIITGLEIGADDYITKPVTLKVLSSRIKAILRRNNKNISDVPNDTSVIKFNNLVIYPQRYELFVENKRVNLTALEFKILHYLAQRQGWVYTRYQIMEAIREIESDVSERSIDFSIFNIRKKLDKYANIIETVRGIGYRFKE
jgi:two-component system, OmpR family, alkaline phosphatase synthesis response regulator PhoP